MLAPVVIAKPLHTFARQEDHACACRYRKTAAHFCATGVKSAKVPKQELQEAVPKTG
jgi:hypothetical protein